MELGKLGALEALFSIIRHRWEDATEQGRALVASALEGLVATATLEICQQAIINDGSIKVVFRISKFAHPGRSCAQKILSHLGQESAALAIQVGHYCPGS